MPKVYSPIAGKEVEVSEAELARRTAGRQPPAPEPPPSYELIVLERDAEGGIKRMIFRPIEPQAAAPAKGKAA